MGRKLYYFHKDSGLEVDFVIRYHSECTLVEVKASDGNTKSTKTILRHPEKYHVSHAIKLGDYNIGRNDQILTLPLYMAFLLKAYKLRYSIMFAKPRRSLQAARFSFRRRFP